MFATAPMPFPAAVARLESKTPVATHLGTDDLQKLELGLLDRAFFSAKVNDIRIVAEMQSRIRDALALVRRDGGAFMSRDKFIVDMRKILGAAPGDSGDLTDITSSRRLGLIYDFNVEDAREYGRWLAAQRSPAILAMFPCSELVRVEARVVPRGYRRGAGGKLIPVPEESWPVRWQAAGGQFYQGRMIALKDSPIWIAVSRFGRPWPPFDFNSGMGLADVERREAIKLRVIDDKTPPPAPQELDFNHKLEATIPDTTPDVLANLRKAFGDQVEAGRDGKVVWQGQRIAKLYSAALTDPAVKWSLDLGEATPKAIEAATAAGADLKDARLFLTADDIRHIETRHGAGERDSSQRPVTSLDMQLIPHVWRAPDKVTSDSPGTLQLTKSLLGRAILVTFDRIAKLPKWGVKTLYIKKEGGRP